MSFILDWEEYWYQTMIHYYNKYKKINKISFTEIWLSCSPIITEELIKKHPEFNWKYSTIENNKNYKIYKHKNKAPINMCYDINNIEYIEYLYNKIENKLQVLKYIDIDILLKNWDIFIVLFNNYPDFTRFICYNKTLTIDFINKFPNHNWSIKILLKTIKFNENNFIEEFEQILDYSKMSNFNPLYHDELKDLNDFFYYLYQNKTITFDCLKQLEIYLQDKKIIYNSLKYRIHNEERSVSFEIFDILDNYSNAINFNNCFNHIIINDFELEKIKYIEKIKKEKYKLICNDLYSVFLHPDNIHYFMERNDEFNILNKQFDYFSREDKTRFPNFVQNNVLLLD